jgi:hypothetical protein
VRVGQQVEKQGGVSRVALGPRTLQYCATIAMRCDAMRCDGARCLLFVLVHTHIVNEKVGWEVETHVIRQGTSTGLIATIIAITCTAEGAGRREAPGVAHRSVEQQIPSHRRHG